MSTASVEVAHRSRRAAIRPSRLERLLSDRSSTGRAGASGGGRRPLSSATTRAFATCRLAEVLLGQGRVDDAEAAVLESERDPFPVLRPRLAASRARIHAARGDPRAAAEVDELLAMVASTPFINQETDALVDAAEAMAALGDTAAATTHARRALELAEAKENLALAGQIRLLLARLAD